MGGERRCHPASVRALQESARPGHSLPRWGFVHTCMSNQELMAEHGTCCSDCSKSGYEGLEQMMMRDRDKLKHVRRHKDAGASLGLITVYSQSAPSACLKSAVSIPRHSMVCPDQQQDPCPCNAHPKKCPPQVSVTWSAEQLCSSWTCISLCRLTEVCDFV